MSGNHRIPLLPTIRRAIVCQILALASAVFAATQVPITFRYYYDDLNQLTKVADSTGVVIQYVYDPVGNILQINRSTVSPGALTLFNATPQTVGAGGMITIQGQGFSPTPSLNAVTIGGVSVTVVSATPTTLVVVSPTSGINGVVSVTVAGVTATSDFSETVIPVPIISSVKPHSAQAVTVTSVSITGNNLAGSVFSVPGGGTVTDSTVAVGGASATLTIMTLGTANGRFAMIAANSFGDSGSLVTTANAYGIFADPNADSDNDGIPNGYELILGTDPFNPDSDGDGFSDGIEVASRSDPLNPPVNCRLTGDSESVTVSILNRGATLGSPMELDSLMFSLLNVGTGGPVFLETDSLLFSALRSSSGSAPVESDFIPFSICNHLSSATCSTFGPLTVTSALTIRRNGVPKPVCLRYCKRTISDVREHEEYRSQENRTFRKAFKLRLERAKRDRFRSLEAVDEKRRAFTTG